jgi:DNA-directed RNA polymerase specialized sigma24 family protein
VNIQLSISSHGTTDIEHKLKQWHVLELKRRTLERLIEEQEKRLDDLKDKLSEDGIRSSLTNIVKEYVQRGSTSDRVGDLVSETLDTVARWEERIREWRLELAKIYADLADIEYYVYQLKPTYREAVIKVYRDGLSQHQVAEAMNFSRSMVDKMIRKSIKSMKGW